MRIIIISDAWLPQVNGVVRAIEHTIDVLEPQGYEVQVIGPASFKTVPMPTYPEIRLALFPYAKLSRMLCELPRAETSIHIATEGPLGWAARRFCRKHGIPFTSAYHTKFPEYIAARFPIPMRWSFAVLRHFHKHSLNVLIPTHTLRETLTEHGFRNLKIWTRGVDTKLFRPMPPVPEIDLPRPIAVCVGRVSVEKNIEAFLDAEFEGSKLVVGDGPAMKDLRKRYPHITFTGAKQGEELAQHYATGDIFVFPSVTDTFGLVLLEALACGLPVVAYPVTGPVDILRGTDIAVLGEDLSASMAEALKIDKQACRDFALQHSWEAATEEFLSSLPPAQPFGEGPPVGASAATAQG